VALVRIETLDGHSQQQKQALMDAVHSALVDALAVPTGDPTLRVIEHPKTNVQLPRTPHTPSEQWTLVEVTLFAGRSQQTKSRLYSEIVRRLGEVGVPALDITIVLIESPTENWGVQGGTPANDIDLGFVVEV
jgi:phenylpyruvate tautomerase PptA (4-oxalocrotonate tautomerase family)